MYSREVSRSHGGMGSAPILSRLPSAVLRQVFNVHALSLQLAFEQRQLFFPDLLTALP